jgi:RNA polymerase sigma-70 factor (ECF subfamily)
LKTVTTHLCLNHLERNRARWRFFSEMGEADAPAFDAPSAAADPGQALDAAKRRARLEAALRALPPHQRVPLVLFHFEQQSCDEIARVLGVSVGKVKTDLHRGRLALRRWLS